MENEIVKTVENSLIPADISADAHAVVQSILTGVPLEPEIARRIRVRGEAIRQEVFERHGSLDIAVPAIRELRGKLPDFNFEKQS